MCCARAGPSGSAAAAAARARTRRRAHVVLDDEEGGQEGQQDGEADLPPGGGRSARDQEQAGAGPGSSAAAAAAASGSGAHKKAGGVAGAASEVPRPDRRSDYRAWVAWQKEHRWRGSRQQRKRRRVEAVAASKRREEEGPAQVGGCWGVGALWAAAPCPPSCTRGPQLPQPRLERSHNPKPAHTPVTHAQMVPTSNMGAFLRQQRAAALHAHWQLLQVAPDRDGRPGLFTAWALVEVNGAASLYRWGGGGTQHGCIGCGGASGIAGSALAAARPKLALTKTGSCRLVHPGRSSPRPQLCIRTNQPVHS